MAFGLGENSKKGKRIHENSAGRESVMDVINDEKLILEREVFTRDTIEKRMLAGGFNSLAKFELFIWDLEMFLQLQRILGDKIILKGGALRYNSISPWQIKEPA